MIGNEKNSIWEIGVYVNSVLIPGQGTKFGMKLLEFLHLFIRPALVTY